MKTSLTRASWRLALLLILFVFVAACTSRNSSGAIASNPLASRTPARSAAAIAAPSASPTHTRKPAALTPAAPVLPTSTASRIPPTLTARITATPTRLACWKAGGRIVTGSLETDLLRLPLTFRVYLPPCYSQEPKRKYPVLYLFHGQSYNDDQWDRLGADETADRLIAAGELPPFLIVMPNERYGGQPDDTLFSQAFVELLVPYIDKTYRTMADRKHRAVGGLSRGAGWSVHFGISYWELFDSIGAHSPAVFHTDAPRMRTWLNAIPREEYPRVYIDLGDRDRPEITRSAEWFEALLNEYDLPHEWHLFSGYHNEEYWTQHVEGYLRWYAADW